MSRRAIDIDALDFEERLQLIEALWDSLSNDPSRVPLSPQQRQELDVRLDRIDAGDNTGIPWEEVLSRVQGRIA
jgi:putative addiction module component (TIGR02574 family)